MNVLFLEAYDGGSHRAFAEGWRRRSRHKVRILSLPARKWKWRMQTAAWVFAQEVEKNPELRDTDLIFATDMVNLSEFLGLTRRRFAHVPALLYFHENQYSYPPQVDGTSDFAWGAVNSASALAADGLIFNSPFHRRDFFRCWRRGNRRMPDARIDEARIDALEKDSLVIPVGIDFDFLDQHETRREGGAPPLILWNHRWEHDKGPEAFFEALAKVKKRGRAFRLAVCGESFPAKPPCFEKAKKDFVDEIEAFGFLKDPADYARLLWEADIVVSTSKQEFLGLSVIEALWCGCHPLLPKRLNYPDLLPAEQHDAHLYDSDADLANRLTDLLDERKNSASNPVYSPRQEHLLAYSQSSVAERLDQLAHKTDLQ